MRPLAALGVTLALLAAAPAAGSPAAARAPQRIHVDCGAARAGDGSRVRPLATLRAASARQLRPGARLLLRRGSVCRGTLAVHGSGRRRSPIVVGAYGDGRRPEIRALGAEALRLRDRSHVVVQDLILANPGDGTTKKRGVHVVAQRRVVRGIVLRRLVVHDVGGNLDKDADGSGGIQASVLGPVQDPPQRFDGLLIERNRVEDVSRSGIFVAGTTDPRRPRATEPWPAASTRVRIRRNALTDLAGDGIVSLGTVGAVVEANVVRRGNLAGRSPFDPAGMVCNAGIWTFHANRTVIQRNEVSHMPFNGCDGTAFDVDYDQDGTVIQRNLSQHNEGGFLLLCTDDAPRRAEVRFNLSVDDGATLHESPCRANAQGFSGTLDAIRVHNNTFVAPAHRIATPASVDAGLPVLANAGTFEFRNNIVVATRRQETPLPCGDFCSHNLFFGLPPSGSHAVTGDPRFVDPARRGTRRRRVGGGFRLRPGSPAIRAGVPIPRSTRRDFFGRRFRGDRPPSIGFHQP